MAVLSGNGGYRCLECLKQTTKLTSAKFKKNDSSKLYYIMDFETRAQNSEAPDEAAHDEPLHRDLRCLQIQLLSFLALQVS